jgi:hypothetical protein
MLVLFSESPVSATLAGRIYNGTYREADGRLHVSSAYGSKSVPVGKRRAGLKEAARAVLADIVKARSR